MIFFISDFAEDWTYFTVSVPFWRPSEDVINWFLQYEVFEEEFVENYFQDVDDQEKVPDLGEALKERWQFS